MGVGTGVGTGEQAVPLARPLAQVAVVGWPRSERLTGTLSARASGVHEGRVPTPCRPRQNLHLRWGAAQHLNFLTSFSIQLQFSSYLIFVFIKKIAGVEIPSTPEKGTQVLLNLLCHKGSSNLQAMSSRKAARIYLYLNNTYSLAGVAQWVSHDL